MTKDQAFTNSRRAELFAELLLQDLNAGFISKATEDYGFDLLAGFRNEQGGINSVMFQVKATDKPVASRFQISRKAYDFLTHSNVPTILLVVNVKDNKIYYAQPSREVSDQSRSTSVVSVSLTEINDQVKEDLRAQLSGRSVVVMA